MTEKDFDKILIRLKTGPWNMLYFFGIGLCGFLTAANVLAGSFLAPVIDHRCHTDEETIERFQCTYTTSGPNGTNGTDIKECTSWEFDNSTYHSTLTSEFEFVCNQHYMRATYQTLYMIGNFFGSPLNGIISDRFGRRTTVTIGSLIFVTSSIVTAWMPDITTLLVLRFILGLMHPAVLQSGYILCMEICEPKHRSTVGILISLPWAIGTIWWGILGYMIRDWRDLQMAASAPGILILVFLLFFDESPRWLIIKGYHNKAVEVMEKAARWNKSTLPDSDKLLDLMKEIQHATAPKEEKNQTASTWRQKLEYLVMQIAILYKTPTIRKRTLLMYADFIVASTVFYGLTLNAKNYSADPFIYMILSGLVEVPAYTLTAPIVAKFGRKGPTSFCYTICGITILTLAFLPSEPKWAVMMLAMIGKMCISAAYQIIYLISSEIFPTEVRLRALGTSNLVARIGATSAPIITGLLGPIYPWSPSLMFGLASISAGFFTIFLPETLMRPLSETVAQLEADEEANKNDMRRKNHPEEVAL